MKVPTTHPGVAELVGAFLRAAPEDSAAAYRQLVGAVWDAGALTPAAQDAVPVIAAVLPKAAPEHLGHLLVLLGLLAEAEYPALDGPVASAVREHLDFFLGLVPGARDGEPLTLALVYLLSHFPADRDRILEAVLDIGLSPDDLSRLDRALTVLEPGERPDLGRVWPSPSAWTLNADELAFDASWINALTSEQITANWENDTRTVLGYTGAKAYWAVCNGAPENTPTATVQGRTGNGADAGRVDAAHLFTPHLAALRCPACEADLRAGEGGVTCAGCGVSYPVAGGILDLTERAADDAGGHADFLEKLSQVPSMGLFYEAVARPAFLRLCGQNWGGDITLDGEDGYLARNIHPVDGPVLDLAAGAGRWTEVIAEIVGAERLVALDMGLPMLTALRSRLPEVPSVLASASDLPFDDASLGAVVCWNALQAFYSHAAAAIAEVGRCLKPGGTFTLLTFRRSDDPVYAYFAHAHRFPQHSGGLELFDLDELKGWLAGAGLTIREESGPGTFVFITAVREETR
ncbi:methyltransferase domain-containing protein [Streptomyces sp. NPDC002073]